MILCLPDEASKEADQWLTEATGNRHTILIDASTAFRTNKNWAYGFPEMDGTQREKIRTSRRISNPGCYPTGFIALCRPLVECGIIPRNAALSINAVSGYSGGGKPLVLLHESEESRDSVEPFGSYGFDLKHKHVGEMTEYSGLDMAPIFHPSVGSFKQGMLVNVPLHYSQLRGNANGQEIHNLLTKHYENSKFVTVMPLVSHPDKPPSSQPYLQRSAFLRPDTLKNTNNMELFVFANDEAKQVILTARLDNLGKGASGAAVQNLNIAFGVEEGMGL